MSGPSRRLLLGAVAAAILAGPAAAQAADKVTLRTNWLFYGSHAIFLLGIDKGFYEKEGIDLTVKQGNGSGNAVRLVANGDSDFAYGSAVTMLNLAAQGAPVIAVATIDAQGADAVLVNPDSGIKDWKDLEGQKVLTTAGAGVNTLFPVAAKNHGIDPEKVSLTNVAENALVSSYLQGLAPAMLGGMDDKPAEIKANGGKQPVILDYGVPQPGYAIVAGKEMVEQNPDLVAPLRQGDAGSGQGRPGQPRRGDRSTDQLVGQRRGPEGAGARGAGLHALDHQVAQQHRRPHRLQRARRLGQCLGDPQDLQGTEDRPAGLGLLHQRLHPAGELSRACPSPSTFWVRPRPSATDPTPSTPSALWTCGSRAARSWPCSGPRAAARAPCS